MPSTRTTRAATQARTEILEQLKEDHKRVKKAYREFQKLDPTEDAEACEQIVQQVLAELTAHATLEEELLYPAAREAIEEDLVDEAEVEHESAKALIEQLEQMSPGDEKYAARFIVLCEYVQHHVKEEESEMFPQLEKAKLDWEALSAEMTARRAELMGSDDEEDEDDEESKAGDVDTDDAEDDEATESTTPGRASAGGGRARSSGSARGGQR